jgi:hypothetical protein
MLLAYFTWVARDDGGSSLTFDEVWAALLTFGGVSAVLTMFTWYRNDWTWALSGSMLSTAMFGRSLDIQTHVDEFSGRPGLAIAVWAILGLSTATAWLVIGAMDDALASDG